MTSDIQKKENYSLVRVNTDKLDINSAPSLKSELILLNNEGEKNIVLDLSKCSYCDSTGLRTILVGNRICENAIGTFIICGLQPDVDYLVRISMLHTVLLITKTPEEAEKLLNKKLKL